MIKGLDVAPVSVVIPCFRCDKTIGRAVQSILQQEQIPAEVILVDDDSDDGTCEVLTELEQAHPSWIKVLRLNTNQGVASARNAGWALASQPYIAFLDADDAWHPKKIEIQYSYMVAHPHVVLSGHGFKQCSVNDSIDDLDLDEYSIKRIKKWSLLLSNAFTTPSVMVRKDIVQRFRSSRRHMEDHLLWLEIVCMGGRAVRISLPLASIYKAQFGSSGLSSQLWKMEKGDLQNLRDLYALNFINLPTWILLFVFSILKFIRRLMIFSWMKVFKYFTKFQSSRAVV